MSDFGMQQTAARHAQHRITHDPMAWSRAFDDPIPVPDGRVPKTLNDTGHYVAALPKATQQRVKRQTAADMLILAAQGRRSVMFADIAMRQALHGGYSPHRLPTRIPS
jgi:hypothetical protein